MEKYDVVIIGSGPGGLTAAVYASRANLKTLIIEKEAPGGKMVKTATIENWTGDILVEGPDLSMRMFQHAQQYGAKYRSGEIKKIVSLGDQQKILTLKNDLQIMSKAVIIASGMKEKVPDSILNIQKFTNKGVSYCAICDGPLFKGNDVAVIGGGNSAIEEAIYLSAIANKVYLIVKFDVTADKKSWKELLTKPNVEIHLKSEVLELHGQDKIDSALVNFNGNHKQIKIAALFPYIGQLPISDFATELNITNERGFIETDDNMETRVKNIFAVGDIRVKNIRQISTAAADGTIAAKILGNNIG